jgi:hypothetical protein
MRSFVKVRETGKTPCIATERRHQDRRAISVPLAGVNDGVSRYLHGGGPPRSAASRQDEKALSRQVIKAAGTAAKYSNDPSQRPTRT